MILAQRDGLTAVDAGAINGPIFKVPAKRPQGFQCTYTTTGSPATIEVRAAVEGSNDGTNWVQIVRFGNQTATGGGSRNAITEAGAGAEAAFPAASDLSVAGTSGVVTWVFSYLRAVTKLQTLTGGTAPTVGISVYVTE